MYRHPDSGPLYLVMEHIQGDDLESCWPTLSNQARNSISEQLRTAFTQMRSLSAPLDVVGGICGGKMPDPIFETEECDTRISGPFTTVQEVASGLALLSRKRSEDNGREGWTAGFLSRQLPRALTGHGVRFTHGDLYMGNILVQKVNTNSKLNNKGTGAELEADNYDYRVKGILDWESAGWYPEYWEYGSAIARPHREDDWPEMVDAVMKPYPAETSMLLITFQHLGIL